MRTLLALAGTVLLLAAGCATTPRANSKAADAAPDATVSTADPSVKTLYAMARLLRTQGKADQEEAVLRKILAQAPNFIPAYADLAELRMRRHLYAEAARELNNGLAVAPNDPVLLNDLGVCALLQEKPEEALQHFTRASEAAPQEARFRTNKALALGLLGRYDESLALYREVLSPEDAEHNLAVIKDMKRTRDSEAEATASLLNESSSAGSAAPQEVAATPVSPAP
jgi:Flp pilus assembly protein TadD